MEQANHHSCPRRGSVIGPRICWPLRLWGERDAETSKERKVRNKFLENNRCPDFLIEYTHYSIATTSRRTLRPLSQFAKSCTIQNRIWLNPKRATGTMTAWRSTACKARFRLPRSRIVSMRSGFLGAVCSSLPGEFAPRARLARSFRLELCRSTSDIAIVFSGAAALIEHRGFPFRSFCSALRRTRRAYHDLC